MNTYISQGSAATYLRRCISFNSSALAVHFGE